MSKTQLQPTGIASELAHCSREQVKRLQERVAELPQYEPKTKEYFHGGMYCREVWREAGVLVVGKVHLKDHFYLLVSGTVLISNGNGPAERVTGPRLFESHPGTKRAVLSETDALCMTFHATSAKTTEEAETELVESDPSSKYAFGNRLKKEVLS